MIGRESARDLLWGNLEDLETALEEGDADQVTLSERAYLTAMTEYSALLPRGDRRELDTRYMEIKQGN